ncbi:MAG: aminoacyl-tRNA hydrolase [Chloroflexi bacterium]|nr:aminoacyl-tRNA hydrolase [Chloroflexota bacterium]
MTLIVGLGNPGPVYARNRHNMGFLCLDLLARRHRIGWSRRSLYQWGEGAVEGIEVVLAKPRTFMNLSGQAVSALARTFRAKPADILVVHDELDLPTGKLRFKVGGSAAGHKGVESIIAELGTRDFPRLRIGIGRPVEGGGLSPEARAEAVTRYVLTDFSAEEEKGIQEAVARAAEAMACYLANGLDTAMSRFH